MVASPSLDESPAAPLLYWRKFGHGHCQTTIERESEFSYFPFDHLGDMAISHQAFTDYRQNSSNLLGSHVFWQAFRVSQTIFIIDQYFDVLCLQRIRMESTMAVKSNDGPRTQFITIFTNETINNNNFDQQTSSASGMPNHIIVYNFTDAGLNVSSEKKAVIHDRIALLDDQIWHCGATIAGMHPGVNALSGGWPDKEKRMHKFFEHLVSKAK
ncbi:MAG: hypothetical protein ACOC4R_00035 [Bacteroidota bacterium]